MVNSLEISWKSPSLYTVFGRPLTPKSLFQGYSQSKEILLNLGMKCWNSAFNLQGSRVIIAVVQVGAVKTYATSVETLERQDETQFTFPPLPPLNANVLICRVYEISPSLWPNSGFQCCLFLALRISLLHSCFLYLFFYGSLSGCLTKEHPKIKFNWLSHQTILEQWFLFCFRNS
jgi:hypothetical protein